MSTIPTERLLRRALIVIALSGLVLGLLAWAIGRGTLANWIWAAGTAPVVVGLLVSMIRDFLAGRMGVDAVAFVSMSANSHQAGQLVEGDVGATQHGSRRLKARPLPRLCYSMSDDQ